MNNRQIHIKKTEDSPQIELIAEESLLRIEGNSIMTRPSEFYEELIHWMELFVQDVEKQLSVEIYLQYINSSSAKYLIKFLMIADRKPQFFSVKWLVHDYDLVMNEKGQEIRHLLTIPVIIELKD